MKHVPSIIAWFSLFVPLGLFWGQVGNTLPVRAEPEPITGWPIASVTIYLISLAFAFFTFGRESGSGK